VTSSFFITGLRATPRQPLINGASADLLRSKATKADQWVIGLRRRRPPLVVAVALANKTARIAWAVMLREKESA
jgi:transposase